MATYRKLAREWHPDKNQHRRAEAERTFSAIAHAYDILKNDVSRRDYNYALKHPEKFAYNQYRYYYSQYYVKHMQVCTERSCVVVLLLGGTFSLVMQTFGCQAAMREADIAEIPRRWNPRDIDATVGSMSSPLPCSVGASLRLVTYVLLRMCRSEPSSPHFEFTWALLC